MNPAIRKEKMDKIKEINSLLQPGTWTDQAVDAFLLGYELGRSQ